MRFVYGELGEKEKAIYLSRLAAYESRFVTLKSQTRIAITDRHGENIGRSINSIQLDRNKIRVVVERYINDLKRLKETHIDPNNEFEASEKKLHRSKIAAYSIKWVLHEHPTFFSGSYDDFKLLPDDIQWIYEDFNILFAQDIMFYHLDFLNDERHETLKGGKYERVFHDLIYYIKTGFYCEKMASLLFDAMYANSAEFKKSTQPIKQ
jgi:hypothetical protein